jgi:transposase InsO family protein
MTIAKLVPITGTAGACRAVGQPRATWYRAHRSSPPPPRLPRPAPRPQPRVLSPAERQQVLGVLHAERFWDAAPATVYATLLDEGSYLCSPSTMYRLLRAQGETGDRRRHATHPPRVKPELLATRPNQCWSWDITKLAGPARWTWFYLYTILDIYSRYAVGWMVAHREGAALAERLLADTLAMQGVEAGTLTIHADRGSSMTAKPVAMLLADLGVTRSHARPHVPDDNPTRRASSRRSSIIRPSPTGSAAFRTPERSASGSSPGTTTSTATVGSRCSPRPTSTTATPSRSPWREGWCWTPPTPPIRSGSSASHPSRLGCPRPCGSTSPSTQRRRLSKFRLTCLTEVDRLRSNRHVKRNRNYTVQKQSLRQTLLPGVAAAPPRTRAATRE